MQSNTAKIEQSLYRRSTRPVSELQEIMKHNSAKELTPDETQRKSVIELKNQIHLPFINGSQHSETQQPEIRRKLLQYNIIIISAIVLNAVLMITFYSVYGKFNILNAQEILCWVVMIGLLVTDKAMVKWEKWRYVVLGSVTVYYFLIESVDYFNHPNDAGGDRALTILEQFVAAPIIYGVMEKIRFIYAKRSNKLPMKVDQTEE